jgi:predicted RNase H-like HicB family nuclease
LFAPRVGCYGCSGADETEYEFTVVIERDEDGRYLALCPALQGCYSEGETEEEARVLIADAIRLHVQDRLATGEPIYHEVGATKVRVAV